MIIMGSNKRLVILSLSVIFLAVFLSLFTTFWKPKKVAVTANYDVHVIVLQKKGSAAIYLNGKDASLVSVFETTLDYNAKDVEVKSASPGGFFVQPLVLASDIKNGKFSFSFNPGLNIPRSDAISTNLPVLSIKFSAKSNLDKTPINLDPAATRVYLFNKGVFTPDISLLKE